MLLESRKLRVVESMCVKIVEILRELKKLLRENLIYFRRRKKLKRIKESNLSYLK